MRIHIPLRLLTAVLGLLIITSIYYIVEVLSNHTVDIGISKYENNIHFFKENYSRFSRARNVLPERDYTKLIDINFRFTIFSSVCEDIALLLLVLVHSAPENYKKRQVIRETWGRTTKNMKILFLLGISNDVYITERLQTENYAHRDLLQGSFSDSYRNLTYKHVMGLKYVVYHCAQAKYILKVDDDTCINIPLLTHFLIKDLPPYGAEKLLMCNVIRQGRAFRSFRSKWRVTIKEYRQRYYPTYCLGWYILYSPDVLFYFYEEAQRTEYFWIDDVHITGIVAAKLNFSGHTDASSLTLSRYETKFLNYIPEFKAKPFLFGWPDMSESEIRSLWEYIVYNYKPQSVTENVIIERFTLGRRTTA